MLSTSLIHEHPLQPPGPSAAPRARGTGPSTLGVPSIHSRASPGAGDSSKPHLPLPERSPWQLGRWRVPAWPMPPLRTGLVIATVTLPDNSPAFGFTAERHRRDAPAQPRSGCSAHPWPAVSLASGDLVPAHRFLTCFIALLCKTTLWLVTFLFFPVSRPRTCQLCIFPLCSFISLLHFLSFHSCQAPFTLTIFPIHYTFLFIANFCFCFTSRKGF